jgi:hypothetical protein
MSDTPQLGFEFVPTSIELKPPVVKLRRAPKTAREARDEGMDKALDYARAKDPAWMAKAVEWVRVYAEKHDQFMCENVRTYALSFGFEEPAGSDKRVWGNVMPAAARRGYITKLGLSYASDPKVHMNPAGLWKSRLRQVPK